MFMLGQGPRPQQQGRMALMTRDDETSTRLRRADATAASKAKHRVAHAAVTSARRALRAQSLATGLPEHRPLRHAVVRAPSAIVVFTAMLVDAAAPQPRRLPCPDRLFVGAAGCRSGRAGAGS